MGWENVRTETEKINKLLLYIETDNITQLGYWMYMRKNKSQKLITKKKETYRKISMSNDNWGKKIEWRIKNLLLKTEMMKSQCGRRWTEYI